MQSGLSPSLSAPDPRGRRVRSDAMKGNIMAQRLWIAACLAVVAACCATVGVVWSQSTRAAAQAAEANHRLVEVLTQTQTTNQEMLKQLLAMAKPAPPAKSQEWIPASLKLTIEKPDGPPAVGFEAWLGRGDGGSSKDGAIHRYSDGEGLARFRRRPAGRLGIPAREPSQRPLTWKTTGNLNALPGSSVPKPIVCPKVPPELASVELKLDWPSDLADKDLCAVALFERMPTAPAISRRDGGGCGVPSGRDGSRSRLSSIPGRISVLLMCLGPKISRIRLLFGGFRPSWRRPNT